MLDSFDENDEHQVLNREEFADLFAAQARMVAHDLYTHGRAVLELRRNRNGSLVGLDPIDATTIAAVRGVNEKVQYVMWTPIVRQPEPLIKV